MFSLVVKHISIRLVLALVPLYDLDLEQLDVKTVFLHENLEERIYMNQPLGFIEKGKRKESLFVAKVFVWP